MTRDRDFKKQVRARMEKTGERYAAARAQLARSAAIGWQDLAGAHAETTAVARLAGAAGLEVSEAMVLGLGGGLGGAYFVFEYKGMPPTFYVATRCHPQYAYGAGFVTTAARRLGLAVDVVETGSKASAAKQLRERVAAGPTIAWLDAGALPWRSYLPGAMGAMPHVVVVSAVDDEGATVHDTAARPMRLTAAALAGARARLPKEKHRLVAARGVEGVDRAAMVREAIASCAAELAGRSHVKQFAGNFGVPGLAKWAGLVTNAKDKKGWPRVFPGGVALWNALTWGYHWIETAGTGGGAFRPLYAAFLAEAATISKRRAVAEVAEVYRELGAAWTALARGMLDGPALLTESREVYDAQARVLAGAAPPGAAPRIAADLPALAALRVRLDALRARAAAGELDGHAAALHAELGARLSAIVERERRAAIQLGQAASLG